MSENEPNPGFQIHLLTFVILTIYVGALWGIYVRWYRTTMDPERPFSFEDIPSFGIFALVTLGWSQVLWAFTHYPNGG